MLTKKIKAFTISELMVTLALTGIMSSFAYMGYNYTQKLLHQFNEQNYFIVQFSELTKRLNLISGLTKEVSMEGENTYVLKSDSINYQIDFYPKYILLKKSGKVDTFHLEVVNLKSGFEMINHPIWAGKLVNHIDFDVVFQKETFHISFDKNYDAYSKLILETQTN